MQYGCPLIDKRIIIIGFYTDSVDGQIYKKGILLIKLIDVFIKKIEAKN